MLPLTNNARYVKLLLCGIVYFYLHLKLDLSSTSVGDDKDDGENPPKKSKTRYSINTVSSWLFKPQYSQTMIKGSDK